MPQLKWTEDGTPYLVDDTPAAPPNGEPLRITVNPFTPVTEARINRDKNIAYDVSRGIGNDIGNFGHMVTNAIGLPGDVAARKFDVKPEVPGYVSDNDLSMLDRSNADIFNRGNDLAGIVMGGGMPIAKLTGAMSGAVGMAGGKPPGWEVIQGGGRKATPTVKDTGFDPEAMAMISGPRQMTVRQVETPKSMMEKGEQFNIPDPSKLAIQHSRTIAEEGKPSQDVWFVKQPSLDPQYKDYPHITDVVTGFFSEQAAKDFIRVAQGKPPEGPLPPNVTKLRSGGDEDVAAPALFGNDKTAPVWHSAVENAVHAAQQELGSPEQWMGMIKNAKGVKPEELQWLGLEDWMKQQKHPVSKKDIVDYLESHRVEVKDALNTNFEEIHGAATASETLDGWLDHSDVGTVPKIKVIREGGHYKLADEDREISFGTFGTKEAAEAEKTKFLKAIKDGDDNYLMDWAMEVGANSEGPGVGRYPQYQLPGGENYGELLLHLPKKDTRNTIQTRMREQGLRGPPTKQEKEIGDYYSGHWDEPNVLAHVRFNDRVIDGKKTLFLEEVQSDWHQEGRKKGYKKPGDKPPPPLPEYFLTKEGDYHILYSPTPRNAINQSPRTIWGSGKSAKEVMDKFEEVTGEKLPKELPTLDPSVVNETTKFHDAMVPDAPFKKTWPDLVLKRMIRHAAENGYDKIAWTPGEVQAKRWRGTGEEGHGKFYDEILVNAANKLGKAHGARVQSEGLRGTRVDYSTERMMAELSPETKKSLGYTDETSTQQRRELWQKLPKKKQEALWEEWRNIPLNVHTMDITPQLKDTALRKGMPLFVSGVPVMPVTHDPFKTKDKNKDQERAPGSPEPIFVPRNMEEAEQYHKQKAPQ